MTTKHAELTLRQYELPQPGFFAQRKLFSLELLPDEKCLFQRRVLSLTGSFPVDAFLWVTDLRLVILQYRWVKPALILEIPRTAIVSIDWHSRDHSRWIDVNYQNPGGKEYIQLRTSGRYRSQKDAAAENQTLSSHLHQIFHKHEKSHDRESHAVPEIPARADGFSKAIVVVGLIGCLCLIPYLAVLYSGARQVLQSYNSSPDCSLSHLAESNLSSGAHCVIDHARITRLYATHSGRSTDYWLVLKNEAYRTETVQIDVAFFRGVQIEDAVQAQRFNGEIVIVVDGPLRVITHQHPQWIVGNYRFGLWFLSGFFLFGIVLILIMRRNLYW
jgi:hypothetical protein